MLTRALLQQEEHPVVFASMGGLDVRKALLLIGGVIVLHSFIERRVGLEVSFGADRT